MVSLNAAVTDARPDDFRPLDVRAAYMMRVMGLDYHRNAMRGRANPRFAWLELVPEPNSQDAYDWLAPGGRLSLWISMVFGLAIWPRRWPTSCIR